MFKESEFGDGKLEFLTFGSISGLGNERFMHGWANRLEQGPGPYRIKFKQPSTTYFQVDGEFFQVVAPKQIDIKLTNFLPNGKIKVLKSH
jgi:diacylglycerol kinase (ATP)